MPPSEIGFGVIGGYRIHDPESAGGAPRACSFVGAMSVAPGSLYEFSRHVHVRGSKSCGCVMHPLEQFSPPTHTHGHSYPWRSPSRKYTLVGPWVLRRDALDDFPPPPRTFTA